MDSAPSNNSLPPHSPSNLLTAWPRPAQFAAVFLLGVVAALIATDAISYTRWGTRPTELNAGYRVDINRADKSELMQLPGIGPRLAGRIENRRTTQGLFRSVDQLAEVDGFGQAKLEGLRPWVKIENSSEAAYPPQKTTGKIADGAPLIDLNSAPVAELQRLPGIGPKLAQRIVEERQQNPFRSIEDLTRVSGIGPKKIDALRRYATIRDATLQTAQVQ